MIRKYFSRFYNLALRAGATPEQAEVIAKNKARRHRAGIKKPAPIEGGEEETVTMPLKPPVKAKK